MLKTLNSSPTKNNSNSASLNTAKKNKRDEFYTQITDIEKELKHYKEHLKGATIFCNCDDPAESNFFRYFALNFDFLGIKKLISTHYNAEKPTYKLEITRGIDLNDDGKLDIEDIVKSPLKGNGDFRSPESIELLKEADIVITNPPFSLFREYLAQLISNFNKFLIIGSMNAITYKEVFPLIRDNRLWLGASLTGGGLEFLVPESYDLPKGGGRTDNNGNKYIKLGNVNWFTNLDYSKRHEPLALYKTYTPEEYPRYDNYDAINVDKVVDIPVDYDGVMGVPITFLDKWNPDQFKILGHTTSSDKAEAVEKIRTDPKKRDRGLINGKIKYDRILIKSKT